MTTEKSFAIAKPYYIDRRFVPLKTFFEYWDIVDDKFDIRTKIITPKWYNCDKPWSKQKSEQYIDSLLRGTYTPPLLFREVKKDLSYFAWELFDGQQRIRAIQRLDTRRKRERIEVPRSLRDIPQYAKVIPDIGNPNVIALPYFYFYQLPHDVQRYIRDIRIEVHVIQGIDEPKNKEHQKAAQHLFKIIRNN